MAQNYRNNQALIDLHILNHIFPQFHCFCCGLYKQTIRCLSFTMNGQTQYICAKCFKRSVVFYCNECNKIYLVNSVLKDTCTVWYHQHTPINQNTSIDQLLYIVMRILQQ